MPVLKKNAMICSRMISERETPAGQLIKQEIRRSGPMTFRQFVELALYHPVHGYYHRARAQRGRQGDYFTSLQVSPLFPQIVADGLIQMWDHLGGEQFTLIEVGAGDGEFLRGVLEALDARGRAKGVKAWAVERGRSARERLWRALSRFPKCQIVPSLDEVEWMGAVDGCIVSNEFFDALAFHRLRFDGNAWVEIYVDVDGDRFIEKTGPLSNAALLDIPGFDNLPFEKDQEIEVRPEVGSFFDEWGRRLSRGYVLTFDYGHPRAQLYSPTRPKGTWLAYYQHQAVQDPFVRIGAQDLTAHVDFTQLVQAGESAGFLPRLFCSQGMYLTHVGQERIDKALRETSGPQRQSIAGAVKQLLHPDAMGEAFWTLVQSKDIDLPPGLSAIPNRLKRLEF